MPCLAPGALNMAILVAGEPWSKQLNAKECLKSMKLRLGDLFDVHFRLADEEAGLQSTPREQFLP